VKLKKMKKAIENKAKNSSIGKRNSMAAKWRKP